MAKKVKNDFCYLGDEAEMRFVKSLIEDGKLYLKVHSMLKPDLFSNPTLKEIVKIMKSYYDERGVIATYKDIEYNLKDSTDDDMMLLQHKKIFTQLKGEELRDGQVTATEKCVNTLKKVEAEKALNTALSALENKGWNEDTILHLQEQITALNCEIEEGEVMASDLLERVFTDTIDIKVPTGIPQLDEQMKGGLNKGALGLLIAGTGVGKTTLGSIMCMGAALQKFKVLHIFFEDLLEDVGRKYYANLTGHYTYEFIEKKNRAELSHLIMGNEEQRIALTQYLKPKRMKNGETTVEDIQNYVRGLIANQGWKPDMIFIDYMSCIKCTTNEVLRAQNEFQMLERAMKRLESFANEMNIAIWVAQQTNRDAFKEDTASNRIGNIQGSFRMTQPASFILYLNRPRGAKDYSTANLYLDKCRGCEPKSWEGIKLDNGTCQIDLSETIRNDEDLEYDMNYDNEYNNNNNNNNNNNYRYGNFKGYTGVF